MLLKGVADYILGRRKLDIEMYTCLVLNRADLMNLLSSGKVSAYVKNVIHKDDVNSL